MQMRYSDWCPALARGEQRGLVWYGQDSHLSNYQSTEHWGHSLVLWGCIQETAWNPPGPSSGSFQASSAQPSPERREAVASLHSHLNRRLPSSFLQNLARHAGSPNDSEVRSTSSGNWGKRRSSAQDSTNRSQHNQMGQDKGHCPAQNFLESVKKTDHGHVHGRVG